jgi:YebC/PmpR family DNA-binding regulatory protein
MSGHSKWATIKHKKAATDAARGKVFTKLIREITVAAKAGGGDAETNSRLRVAVNNARAENMPLGHIEKAIQKGTGELPGVVYEECNYEGYGPGGVALFIETLTDNHKRTVATIRHLLERHGGSLGANGCVAWMFDQKGVVVIDAEDVNEDNLLLTVSDAGADDMNKVSEIYEVITPVKELNNVREAVAGAGYNVKSANMAMIPQTLIKLSGREAETMLKLMDALDDCDDVQNIYANFDLDEEE